MYILTLHYVVRSTTNFWFILCINYWATEVENLLQKKLRTLIFFGQLLLF